MRTVQWVGVKPSRQVGGRNVVKHLEDGHVEPLPPCNNIVNHSPDGFHWGYHGSGPAQLALALVYDYFCGLDVRDCQDYALRYYQDFKFKVIAQFSQEGGWTLTREEVATVIKEIDEERG